MYAKPKKQSFQNFFFSPQNFQNYGYANTDLDLKEKSQKTFAIFYDQNGQEIK